MDEVMEELKQENLYFDSEKELKSYLKKERRAKKMEVEEEPVKKSKKAKKQEVEEKVEEFEEEEEKPKKKKKVKA